MAGYRALRREGVNDLHELRMLRFIDTDQASTIEQLTGDEAAQSGCPAEERWRLVTRRETRHNRASDRTCPRWIRHRIDMRGVSLLLDQSTPHRLADGARFRMHMELVVDRPDIGAHRVHADRQPIARRLVAVPVGEELQQPQFL